MAMASGAEGRRFEPRREVLGPRVWALRLRPFVERPSNESLRDRPTGRAGASPSARERRVAATVCEAGVGTAAQDSRGHPWAIRCAEVWLAPGAVDDSPGQPLAPRWTNRLRRARGGVGGPFCWRVLGESCKCRRANASGQR